MPQTAQELTSEQLKRGVLLVDASMMNGTQRVQVSRGRKGKIAVCHYFPAGEQDFPNVHWFDTDEAAENRARALIRAGIEQGREIALA